MFSSHVICCDEKVMLVDIKVFYFSSSIVSIFLNFFNWFSFSVNFFPTRFQWWVTDDKAGQVQSKLSTGGTKREVENTPKCTRPNRILARLSNLGPLGGIGPSDDDDKDNITIWQFWHNLETTSRQLWDSENAQTFDMMRKWLNSFRFGQSYFRPIGQKCFENHEENIWVSSSSVWLTNLSSPNRASSKNSKKCQMLPTGQRYASPKVAS